MAVIEGVGLVDVKPFGPDHWYEKLPVLFVTKADKFKEVFSQKVKVGASVTFGFSCTNIETLAVAWQPAWSFRVTSYEPVAPKVATNDGFCTVELKPPAPIHVYV